MRQKDKERLDFICIEHTGFNFSDVCSKGINYTTMEKIIERYTDEIENSRKEEVTAKIYAFEIPDNKIILEKENTKKKNISKSPFTVFREWLRKTF